MQVHQRKFWFVENLGKEVSTFFKNANEITLFLLRVEKQIYYVIENTLNIYKINKVFLVTSCFSVWELMSNCLTWNSKTKFQVATL